MRIILFETTGHRLSYAEYVRNLFSAEPPLVYQHKIVLSTIVYRKTLVFTSVDDSWVIFLLIAAIRTFFGLRTVGVVLTPKILEITNGLQPRVRLAKLLIQLYSLVGRFRVITPVPKLESDVPLGDIRFVHGPEWLVKENSFIHEISEKQPNNCPPINCSGLSGKLFFYGSTGEHKDLRSLNRLLDRHVGLELIFYRNPVTAEPLCDQQIMMKKRALELEEKYFTDRELIEKLEQVDFVWACYANGYDQASGVVASAILSSKIPILRKGSRAQIDLERHNLRHLLVSPCEDLKVEYVRGHRNLSATLIEEWKDDFVSAFKGL